MWERDERMWQRDDNTVCVGVCGKELKARGKDMRECGKEMIILYVWEYVGKT
jgi:hypothetical protein